MSFGEGEPDDPELLIDLGFDENGLIIISSEVTTKDKLDEWLKTDTVVDLEDVR